MGRAVLAHGVDAGLHDGDADLLAGLGIVAVAQLRGLHHRTVHRLGGGPTADEPGVFVDLILQRPAVVDVAEQVNGAADMIGDHVEDAVVDTQKVALFGHAAVDAEVVPRGGGGGLEDLIHGLARIASGIDGDGRLGAEDKVHLRVGQRLAAQPPEVETSQLFGDHDLGGDGAAAVQLEIGRGGAGVVVQPTEYAGLGAAVHLEDGLIALGGLDDDAHAAAGPQTRVGLAPIAALLTHQLQVHIEGIQHVRAGDGDIPAAVFQIAGTHGDAELALNDLQIVADGRELQPDGRDGDVVAVDGVGQPVDTAAAASQEGRGYRRDQRDAGLHRQLEVQVVGSQPAVFQPLELKLRRRLKQIKGIELQRKVVLLLTVKGVDGGLQLRQLQPDQGGGVDLAVGLDAVLLEADAAILVGFRPIAQRLQRQQRVGAAIQNEVQPHPAGQDQIAPGLELRRVDEAGDLGDVEKHQNSVVLRDHGEGQARLVKGQPRRRRHGADRAVQPEAGRAVFHAGGGVEAGDDAVFVHAHAEVLAAAAPCGDNGGRQGHLAVGEGVVLAGIVRGGVKVTAQNVQRRAVLLLQNGLPRGVRNGRGQNAAIRLIEAQPVRVLRDGDTVRLGEPHLGGRGGLRLGIHIAEAPDVQGIHLGAACASAQRIGVALGGQQVLFRVIGHVYRRPHITGVADTVHIRQHEGTVHTVAVGVDLRHIALAEAAGHAGAAQTAGDVRASGGQRVAGLIGAAQLHMGRRVRLRVAHAGEAMIVLIPAEHERGGHGGLRDHAQPPRRLCHQGVGPAVRALRHVREDAVHRTGRQLHEVVADVAQQLLGQGVAAQGVFDGQGIFHGRHIHADAAELRLLGRIDDLHLLDGQVLLGAACLQGKAGLLIHAPPNRRHGGRVAAVRIGHGLAHVGPVHRQKEHQLPVVHFQRIDTGTVVDALTFYRGGRGLRMEVLVQLTHIGERLRRQQCKSDQQHQQQGNTSFFHGASPSFSVLFQNI